MASRQSESKGNFSSQWRGRVEIRRLWCEGDVNAKILGNLQLTTFIDDTETVCLRLSVG